jgi:hypothetical protein
MQDVPRRNATARENVCKSEGRRAPAPTVGKGRSQSMRRTTPHTCCGTDRLTVNHHLLKVAKICAVVAAPVNVEKAADQNYFGGSV